MKKSTRKRIPKTVVARLQEWRKAHRMTLAQLADQLGFSVAKVQRILARNVTTASPEDLATIKTFIKANGPSPQQTLEFSGPTTTMTVGQLTEGQADKIAKAVNSIEVVQATSDLDRTVALTVLKHVAVKSDTLEQFKTKLSKTRYADAVTALTVDELLEALA